MAKGRSPFGALLRAHRLQQGLSQGGLAQLIEERSHADPRFAELGVLSEKAISNLEAKRERPDLFVRPRPLTVRLLANALGIEAGSPEEETFLAAADITRRRDATAAQTPDPAPTEIVSPPTAAPRSEFIREGREAHLQHLERLLDEALAGRPQIALLAGEPGVGKTWMISEICRIAQQRDPNVMVAWGECTSGAASVEPYLPFRQALSHLLGSTWGRPSAAAHAPDQLKRRTHVLEALLSHAPALVGTYIDESYLIAQASELGIADQAWHDRLSSIVARRGGTDMQGRFDQVARLLGAVAAANPMILVLEDLHWADERTCTLLFHMQRRLQHVTGMPILILGSYRPSDLVPAESEPRHPLEAVLNEIGRHLDHATIDLSTTVGDAPGRAFISALLDRVLEDANDGFGDFLYERTKGYPLFAVELLRWLRDTGVLSRGTAGQWSLTNDIPRIHTPNKVRAVIAERLARLSDDLQRILAIAAVQGSVFMIDIVSKALGLSPEAVDDLIDHQLVNRYRLIHPVDTITLAGQRLYRYRFAHALFQEYLYGTLSVRQRERLHGSIAQALDQVLGDGAHGGSAEIAFHYEQAGDQKRAGKHAFQAGKHAIHMTGYEVAADWFHRAVALGTAAGDHELVGFARNGLAGSARSRGLPEEGVRFASQALADAQQHGCPAVAAESLALLGLFSHDRGKHAEAVAYLRRALAQNQELGDLSSAAGNESLLSHGFYGLGAYDQALAHARNSYETAKAVGHDRYAAEGLLAAANCEVDLGRYALAIDTYAKTSSIYNAAGDLRGVALCQLNTGLCLVQLGESDRARPILMQAKKLCDDLRLTRLQAVTHHYLGLAYEGAGNHNEAESAFRAARDRRRALDQEGLAIDSVAGLLRLATARDDRDQMSKLAGEVEGWIARNGVEGIEDPITAYLNCIRARCALGDVATAHSLVREGIELLTRRAERIADPLSRQSYLSQVPANDALVQWHRTHAPRISDNGEHDTKTHH